MKNNKYLIKNGQIVDPLNKINKISDLYIENGLIVPPPISSNDFIVINAEGMAVVPGFIDMHAHFREPGDEKSETIKSGSMAAARGGFTTVVTMPNTTPPIDTKKQIIWLRKQAEIYKYVNIMPAACITDGRRGNKLTNMKELAEAGAVAFTDDGSTVINESLMEEAMKTAKSLNIPIMDHALNPFIANDGVMHEGRNSAILGLKGIPSSAETEIVARDIAIAKSTECSIHIQHISAKESIILIKNAQSNGLQISAEATPHHLALTDSDIRNDNTSLKVNPPLRTEEDRQAILSAVADGTIEALATDHAPHNSEKKEGGFNISAFGAIGLETAIGITYELLVESGLINISEWVARWTIGPANILGITPPSLSPGLKANLAILDLKSKWIVNSKDFLSLSTNTPFEGKKIKGRAVYTFYNGIITWKQICHEKL